MATMTVRFFDLLLLLLLPQATLLLQVLLWMQLTAMLMMVMFIMMVMVLPSVTIMLVMIHGEPTHPPVDLPEVCQALEAGLRRTTH